MVQTLMHFCQQSNESLWRNKHEVGQEAGHFDKTYEKSHPKFIWFKGVSFLGSLHNVNVH